MHACYSDNYTIDTNQKVSNPLDPVPSTAIQQTNSLYFYHTKNVVDGGTHLALNYDAHHFRETISSQGVIFILFLGDHYISIRKGEGSGKGCCAGEGGYDL